MSRLRTHQALAARNLPPPEANLKGIRKLVFQNEAQFSYISGLLKLKKLIPFYFILELEVETSYFFPFRFNVPILKGRFWRKKLYIFVLYPFHLVSVFGTILETILEFILEPKMSEH